MIPETVQIILSIFLNTLTVGNVVLISELLFGMQIIEDDTHTRRSRLLIVYISSALLYTAAILFRLDENVQFIGIIMIMMLAELFLSHRFIPILSVIPAILIDLEFATILNLTDRLLRLDRYSFLVEDSIQTPLYFSADAILLLLLFLFRRLCLRKQLAIKLNPGETIAVCIFCIFVPVMNMIMNTILQKDGRFVTELGWIVFLILLNAACFYGIIHRNLTSPTAPLPVS